MNMQLTTFANVSTEGQLAELLSRFDPNKPGIHARRFDLFDTVDIATGAQAVKSFFKNDQSRDDSETNMENANDPLGASVMLAEGVSFDLYRPGSFKIDTAADTFYDELYSLLDSGVMVLSVDGRVLEKLPLRHVPSLYLPQPAGTTGIIDVPHVAAKEPRRISPVLIRKGIRLAAELKFKPGTTAAHVWKARLNLHGQRFDKRG